MGFLRVLLIFVLLYLSVRLLGRLLFPPRQSGYGPEEGKPEGDVTVENKGPQGKKINKDEGDYVDYEEIK